MSGIYISGVKMPEKEQLVIFRIWGNGQVERLEGYRPFLLYGVKATDIPDHGDLIDRDMVLEKAWDVETFVDAVRFAPTIIESEGDDEMC